MYRNPKWQKIHFGYDRTHREIFIGEYQVKKRKSTAENPQLRWQKGWSEDITDEIVPLLSRKMFDMMILRQKEEKRAAGNKKEKPLKHYFGWKTREGTILFVPNGYDFVIAKKLPIKR